MSFNYFYNSLPSLNDNQIGKVYESTTPLKTRTLLRQNINPTQAVVCNLTNIPKGYYFVRYNVQAVNLIGVIYASLEWVNGTTTITAPNNYFCQTGGINPCINGSYYITITADSTTINVRLVVPSSTAYGGAQVTTASANRSCWLQAIRIA